MNIHLPTKSIAALAVSALFLVTTGAKAQLITVDFNTQDGASSTQSLMNAGSASVTSTFVGGGAYSSSFAPSNAAGFSGTFGSGGNSKVTVTGGGAALSNLQSFTLTAWVNPSSFATNGSRIFYSLAAGNVPIQFILGSTGITFAVDGVSAVAPITLSLNTWTFLAVTYDGTATSNNVNIYTGDGTTLSAATTLTANAGTTLGTYGDLYIGAINASDTTRNYRGLLDDAHVYGASSGAGGALSSSALTSVMQLNDVVPEPTCVSLVAFSAVGFLVSRRKRLAA